MRLVEAAQYAPGCCVLGGGHEKLVDFERTMPLIHRDNPMFNAEGDRMYVAQQFIADAARLMGFAGPEEVAKLQARIKELSHKSVRLAQVEDELVELKRSVAVTLQAGAVVDKRTGEIKPRLASGQKREQVSV